MSGHSKWANIKNRKGAQDKKRSEAFTKMAKNIMTAVRIGGGNTNPDANVGLKTAIEKAKSVNMPKENIERLLKRFDERKANLSGGMYEGYGPFGVPLMIEVETDNKNRTIGEIKLILRNYDGMLGESGSVAFMFEKRGEVEVEIALTEELMLDLIDSGASDFEDKIIYTDPMLLKQVTSKLDELGIGIEYSGLVMKNKSPVVLDSEEKLQKVLDLIDELEEHEDVINVFSGFDYHG